MIRNCSLDEISDGKLYRENDMAKLGCNQCSGCSSCCKNMGRSIVLDPLDVFRIKKGLGKTFEELLNDKLELNIVDGVILPNIKMCEKSLSCGFLNEEGRCSIHVLRPSVCRLFPLGRIYENNDFNYFLQRDQCKKKNRTKVKISKWIDVEDVDKNREYVITWHFLLKDIENKVKEMNSENDIKQIEMLVLNLFYMNVAAKNIDEFYEEFYRKVASIKRLLTELQNIGNNYRR